MEKKIRVTLDKKIVELLENDSREYSIKLNNLLNNIYEEYSKNLNGNEKKKIKTDSTILQFSLNKNNKENYYNFLKENKIQNEAEFFRKIFTEYSLKIKKEREIFLYRKIIKLIEIAILEKKILKITFYDGKIVEIEPYFIGSSNLELGNYLFSYSVSEKSWKNYKLKYIKSVFIKNENFEIRDYQYIDKLKKNYDPFLSFGKKIKVKLSKEGEKLFNILEINRPKFIKKVDDIYILEASEEKAKRYFGYFLNEAEVIEPLELREWFKEHFRLALKMYDDI